MGKVCRSCLSECHRPTTFKFKNTRTTRRMWTATSTTATMPRTRSPSPSTTSKWKHQHNISEHCWQQIPFFCTVCFTGYNEWKEGVKHLHFYCSLLGKKLSCQHRILQPQHKFCCVGCCCMSCITQGNATHNTLTAGGANLDKAWDKLKLKICAISH